MQALLEAGANKSAAAQDDMSTLHFASQQGHTEVVRMLLNAGVCIALPYYMLFATRKWSCMSACCTRSSRPRRIRCAGLKVNSKMRKGTNALHFAAKKGALHYGAHAA